MQSPEEIMQRNFPHGLIQPCMRQITKLTQPIFFLSIITVLPTYFQDLELKL